MRITDCIMNYKIDTMLGSYGINNKKKYLTT